LIKINKKPGFPQGFAYWKNIFYLGRLMTTLTNRDKNICSYGGLFGVLLTLTCLIQHLAITTTHWLVAVMIFMYIFSIVSFSLLIAQKWLASFLLIVNSVSTLIVTMILILSGVFSLVVIFLFFYTTITTVFVFVEQITSKLKQKTMALKAEEELWRGKL
jgi:hypothetical protein